MWFFNFLTLGPKIMSKMIHIFLGPLYATLESADPTYQQGSTPTDRGICSCHIFNSCVSSNCPVDWRKNLDIIVMSISNINIPVGIYRKMFWIYKLTITYSF